MSGNCRRDSRIGDDCEVIVDKRFHQLPVEEDAPVLRAFDSEGRDWEFLLEQIEAEPPQVRPAGQITFACKTGRGGVRFSDGKARVERALWFELVERTPSSPKFAIIHIHYDGLWEDYVANSERAEAAVRFITQINVRHSQSAAPLSRAYQGLYQGGPGSEAYYGVYQEQRGVPVFEAERNGGKWNWQQDMPTESDGWTVAGRKLKPRFPRLLRLFYGHPFYRELANPLSEEEPAILFSDTPPSASAAASTSAVDRAGNRATEQRTGMAIQAGAVAGSSHMPTGASGSSGSGRFLIFVCSPQGARSLPKAVEEAKCIQKKHPASIFGESDDCTALSLKQQLLARPTCHFLFIG
eukprot:2968669-Prymnesium_polylepis.2